MEAGTVPEPFRGDHRRMASIIAGATGGRALSADDQVMARRLSSACNVTAEPGLLSFCHVQKASMICSRWLAVC